MGMSEREYHINVLEQFLQDYQEWEGDLELGKSIKYALQSLKTDLKYDLMYEGEEIYTKDDMVAMLTEIREKVWYHHSKFDDDRDFEVDKAVEDIVNHIDAKINELKGEENGNDKATVNE